MDETISLLAKVVPLALAAAVSPVVFTFAGLLLSQRTHPIGRTVAFAAGAAVVVVAIGLLGLFAIHIAPGDAQHKHGVIRVAAGAMLLAYAGYLVIRGPREKRRDAPKTDASTELRPLRFAALGAGAMLTNVTTLALYIPLIEEISRASVDRAEKALVLVIADLIILLPALIPIAAYLIAPETAQRLLGAVNGFLSRHRHTMLVAIAGGFGAYLLIDGISAL